MRQLKTNDPADVCRISDPTTRRPGSPHGTGAVVANSDDLGWRVNVDAADVGEQTRQSPAQRYQAESIGGAPAPRRRPRERRSRSPCTAQRGGQHDLGLHGVSHRTGRRRPAQPRRSACPTAARRRRVAIASSALTHASRTGSRAGTSSCELVGAAAAVARRREPADAERVGGQTDQGVGPRLDVATRRAPRRGRPTTARLHVPPSWRRNDALRAVCERRERSRPRRCGRARRGRPSRWRTGPARRGDRALPSFQRRARRRAAASDPGQSPKAASASVLI